MKKCANIFQINATVHKVHLDIFIDNNGVMHLAVNVFFRNSDVQLMPGLDLYASRGLGLYLLL
jgi:hypothetical protein